MKNSSFVLSAIILALGGFFAKAIGALYKIPLTNILGSGGMGLYYLIFPVYSLIITFCSSGLGVALSTEVAKCRAIRHRYNEQKLLRVALVMSFLISLIFTIVVLVIAKPLSIMQGNINASLGYVAIAPAIMLSSIISTIRGYFQGVENMVPTTVSMIVEQIVKLSFGLILAHKLCVKGIEYAVFGAVIGVTISEGVALIIIAINFFLFKGQMYYNYKNLCYKGKKCRKLKPKLKSQELVRILNFSNMQSKIYKCNAKTIRYTTKVAIRKLLKTFLPATLTSIVLPIATMLDSFLIINTLIDSGYSSYVSTSLYGLWGGVVQSLISLPIILIAGLSTSMVPSLSGVVAEDNCGKVNKRVVFFVKITLVLAILMFGIVFVFAEDILYFLYGDGLSSGVIDELFYATKMLKMASVSIIYYAFLQTFTVIFQTLGKSYIPFFALVVGLVGKVVLTKVLVSIYNINIFGAVIANTLFLGVATIIMAIFIRQKLELNFVLPRTLFMPIVMGLTSMVLMFGLHQGLSLIMNYFVSMIISVIVGCVVFVLWVYWGKVFDDRERRSFFCRNKKLARKKF